MCEGLCRKALDECLGVLCLAHAPRGPVLFGVSAHNKLHLHKMDLGVTRGRPHILNTHPPMHKLPHVLRILTFPSHSRPKTSSATKWRRVQAVMVLTMMMLTMCLMNKWRRKQNSYHLKGMCRHSSSKMLSLRNKPSNMTTWRRPTPTTLGRGIASSGCRSS